MALPTVTNTESTKGTLPRRRLQTEVSEKTARMLHAVAKLSDRPLGAVIDDLAAELLPKLLDMESLLASQSSKEENDA